MTIELEALELQANRVDFTNTSNNIIGTQTEDILIGTSSAESISGLNADDIIVGKGSNDTLAGGAGSDRLISGDGSNLLLGNEGNDTLAASSSRSNTVNNVFNGGAGNDLIVDRIIGSDSNSLLSGEADNDIILGFNGKDNILGGAGADGINGGAGSDRVLGEDGDDELEGGDGDDLVIGGNGSDFIRGLEGFDTLTGESGVDFFYLIPNTGRDVITDFEDGVDKLVLTPIPRFGSEFNFSDLSIVPSNNGTKIVLNETNEIATLRGVDPSLVDSSDFVSNEELESEPRLSQLTIDQLIPFPLTEYITNQSEGLTRQEESNSDISTGIVTSQGAEVINAPLARQRFGVDGNGVTVGILSDSFDRSGLDSVTAKDDIATEDLPRADNVSTLDDSADNSLFFSLPNRFIGTLNDEGRALAQIVTDVAPGANILFRTAFGGADNFAKGIDELVAAGADIIVDDVGYPNEPFFQDGAVAQAASRAVDAGVPYFTSAGNSDRASYEAEFRPVADNNLEIPGLDHYTFHDFNPGEEIDISQNFTLEPGELVVLSTQWDEPFASAGGKGASNDLDVFLLDANNNIVSLGAKSNVGGDAVEFLGYINSTETAAQYKLLIGQDTEAGGEAPNLIKYIEFFGDNITEAEYFTNSATLFGQQNAANTSAVGASFYQTPTELEPFSSVGIVPILFDEQGDRLPEPELRQKPDIIAPDGVNTTFFGGSDVEEDGLVNFFGTSAASPHAAGVAALLLDAVPDATPQEVYGALEQTAIDLDNPFTPEFDTGYDTATGFGLIQADLALESLLG